MTEPHRPAWYTGPDDPHLDVAMDPHGTWRCGCGRAAPINRVTLLAYAAGCTLIQPACRTCGGRPVCEPECAELHRLLAAGQDFMPPPGMAEELHRRALARQEEELLDLEREMASIAEQLAELDESDQAAER